jgi:hypothetical protein
MNAIIVLLCSLLAAPLLRAEDLSLDEKLQPLKPFLGMWRGEFNRSTPENPMVDISKCALNGKAVRITHSINQGFYGGESLVFWDKKEGVVAFRYFTTADFRTEGTIKIDGKKLTTHEKVIGEGGAEEVRATFELRDQETMVVKSEMLRNGSWQPAHEIRYRRAPEATVQFK